MKLDARLPSCSLLQVPAMARGAEELGFAGLWSSETQHDGFLPLAVAATQTSRIELGTSIALAFTRSPMAIAYTAWDLQAASGGRFILGLGTQVKGHIERRFSVKWDRPAPRLREIIQALRAIWGSWQDGTKLDWQGEFYKFTLMTPFFNPGPIPHPRIPIHVAGVGEALCRLAGEVADGFQVHPLHTVKYLRDVALPAIQGGLDRSGRSRPDLALCASVFVATGADGHAIAEARAALRGQIAFYASTPTYRPVMDLHGWGETARHLTKMSVAGDWDGMAAQITDEMLGVFAISGPYEAVGTKVRQRYAGLLDRVALYTPFAPGDEAAWREIVKSFNT